MSARAANLLAVVLVGLAVVEVAGGVPRDTLWVRFVIAGVLCAAAVVIVRRARRSRDGDGPLISLVCLLREQRNIELEQLRLVVNRALGLKLTDGDDDAAEFLVGEPPAFMLRLERGFFLVNVFAAPYPDIPPERADKIAELRSRAAVAEHTAWLSVDLLRLDQGIDQLAAYQVIGKLVAALAEPDCLAIYAPQSGRLVPFDDSLKAKLRGDNPLDDLAPGFVPVLQAPENDAELKAAQDEAQRRWAEFVKAFEERAAGQMFSVKRPFSDGENVEHMWIEVRAIENDVAYGVIGNDPVNLRGMKADAPAKARRTDIEDLLYLDKAGQMCGGFSVKVLMARGRSR